MKHRIELVRRILRFCYEALFSVLLMDFFLIIFIKEQPSVMGNLLVFGLYVVSYLGREWNPNVLVLLLCHVIPVAGIVFAPVSRGFLWGIILLDIYLFCEAYAYFRRNMVLMPVTDLPWATFLLSFIIYLYGYFTHSDIIVKHAYIIPVMLIFIYLVSIYLDGLRKYLESVKDVDGLPVHRMIFVNTIIVAVVLGILLLTIMACRIIDIGSIFAGLGQGLVAIGRVIWLVLSFFGAILGSLITTGRSNLAAHSDTYGNDIAKAAGPLGSAMETVLKFVLFAALLYLIYRLLVKLVHVLVVKRQREGDIVEEMGKKTERRIRREYIGGIHLKRLNDEEKIRRLYRNSILQHRYDIKLDVGKTTRMIEQEISDKRLGDVHNMTEIYNSVRYGECKADRHLVKSMKQLVKHEPSGSKTN